MAAGTLIVSNSAVGPVAAGLDMTITPLATGIIEVSVYGCVQSFEADISPIKLEMQYGTGTPPTTGGGIYGMPIGGQLWSSSTDGEYPFAMTSITTALTVGTTYWFDVAVFQDLELYGPLTMTLKELP